MPYFKVDDKLHSHVKAMRAGTAALGLWVQAASWCMDQLTDGWVPEYAALRLAGADAEDHASALVRAGLWHVEDRDGERGWLFHEWDEWQHSASYLEERRRRNADRMRTQRANGQAGKGAKRVRAHSVDSADTVSSTPTTTTTTTRTPAGAAAPESFDAFWSSYPRKVGKQAAAKAYAKALKSADADTILAGLHAAAAGWRACGTEARFIPHPSTWLNEGRWEDQDQLPVEHQGVTQAGQVQVRRRELPPPPPELAGDPRAEQQWMREQLAALQAGGQ